MALTDKLTAIANGFRTSRGTQDKYTLDQMAVLAAEKVGADPVINPLSITANGTYTASDCDGYSPITVAVPQEGAPTAEELTASGKCQYKFAYGWNWFISKYGDRITTKNVIDSSCMFYNCYVDVIPFDINYKPDEIFHDMSEMFSNSQIEVAPILVNAIPCEDDKLFFGCKYLRIVPEDFARDFDWSYMEKQTSAYSCKRNAIFSGCYSLRSFPMSYLAHGNPKLSYSYSLYNNLFSECYALGEVIDLPNPHPEATWTSNVFGSTFHKCYRLKNFTFALDPETNAPYVVNWKSQTIDLRAAGSEPVAVNPSALSEKPAVYASLYSNVCTYNSGIAPEKAIVDDATYQALKDDPDSFVLAGGSASASPYSRYNHDSAVATINSLPDTSAYLATAGGTNTIQFKGSCGSATDGGAINTLTEEEIAVATAKGWTVSLS